MRTYELTFEVEHHDGVDPYTTFSLDSWRIVDGKKVSQGTEYTAFIARRLKSVGVENCYEADYYMPFYIGPVLVKRGTLTGPITVKFTSEDVKKFKEEGGPAKKDIELRIALQVEALLDLMSVKEARARVNNIIKQVVVERVMDV